MADESALAIDIGGTSMKTGVVTRRAGTLAVTHQAVTQHQHNDIESLVETVLTTIRTALDEANTDRACRILGPAPAPLSRLKGEHRIHLLIKSRSRPRLREVIDIAFADAAERGSDLRSVNLEIDPINLM